MPTDTYILAAGADDAHEDADGTGFSATATTVQVNYRVSASSRRHAGFRFDNIGIPPGSTIVSAYLMPVVASSVDNDLECDVYLHDVDDSQNFTDLADVTTRLASGATSASVNWDAQNVGGIGERVTSPDIATPVQEVIDRPGWALNNALTVLLRADTEDSGNCHFASFENTTYDPAHLQITWTEPQTSFSLKVDLDDDGDFADAAEDVTSNAWLAPGRGVITFRGNDAARRGWEPRGGSLLFELLNEDGTYDRDTTTLTEHDPAKLTATFGSTLYQVWTGRTSQVEYHPELRRQSVSVAAQGALARFGNRSGASSAVFASVTIDEAIGHLLDAAGFDKNVADYCITDLAFDAYYGLGETSGDALDGTTNGNDLTVTSAAARDATALDDGGDGAIEFDGALTKLEAAVDVLDNMWDGGGALAFTFDADSDGEGSVGIVAGKVGWTLNVQDEAAGLVRLNFTVDFDTTDGTWQTAVDIPITTTIAGVLVYDSDAVGNNPTLYLSTDGATIDTLTVGSGLTETSTPIGTRVSDAASNFVIGNNTGQTATFDGHIDEVGGKASTLTAAQAIGYVSRVLNARRHLDVSAVTLDYWWLDSQETILQALYALMNTDGPHAQIYEDGTGAIVFKNDAARTTEGRSTSVQQTIRGSGIDPLIDHLVKHNIGVRSIVDVASLEWVTRSVTTTAPYVVDITTVAEEGGGADGSIDVPAPTGMQLNDVIFLTNHVTGTGTTVPTMATPSGYTLAQSRSVTDSTESNFAVLSMYWKRITDPSGEPATYTATYSGGTDIHNWANAVLVRGAPDSGDPFEDATFASGVNQSGELTMTLTLGGENRLWLGSMIGASRPIGSPTLGPPTGGATIASDGNSSAQPVSNYITFTEDMGATTGSTSNNPTATGVQNDVAAVAVAIPPAATVVWRAGQDIVLGNDEVLSLTARSSQPFQNASAPASGTDFTVSAGSLASGPTLNRTSGSSVEITMTAGGSGATIQGPTGSTATGMQLRADTIGITARGEAIKDSSASNEPDNNLYPLQYRKEVTRSQQQTTVDAYITALSSPREWAVVDVRAWNGATMLAMLDLEISDRVRLIEATHGIDLTGWVESIEWRIGPALDVVARITIRETAS